MFWVTSFIEPWKGSGDFSALNVYRDLCIMPSSQVKQNCLITLITTLQLQGKQSPLVTGGLVGQKQVHTRYLSI